jgi:adenylosuccinate synthase
MKKKPVLLMNFKKDLRFGDLDYDLLNYALKTDEAYVAAQKKNLVITCLDQLDEKV